MRRLLCGVAFAALATQAAAQPPTAESIETLLTLTRAEAVMDQMFDFMAQAMRQGVAAETERAGLTTAQKQAMDAVPGRMMEVARQEMRWATLKPQYVRLYQETFEQADIDGMIAFYRSPAGQASITKMPVVMQKSMTISQGEIRRLMPKLKQVLDDAINQAKAAK